MINHRRKRPPRKTDGLVLAWGMLVWVLITFSAFGAEKKDIKKKSDGPVAETVVWSKGASGAMEVAATIHLGKNWCESLKQFPTKESRIVIVEFKLKSHHPHLVTLDLSGIRLNLPEAEQRLVPSRTEEFAPTVYLRTGTLLGDDEVQQGAPRVRGRMGTSPTGSGGVIDIVGTIKDAKKSNSLGQFQIEMYRREFKHSMIKPEQTLEGWLLFCLPWDMENLEGVILELVGLDGSDEKFLLPATPKQ